MTMSAVAIKLDVDHSADPHDVFRLATRVANVNQCDVSFTFVDVGCRVQPGEDVTTLVEWWRSLSQQNR